MYTRKVGSIFSQYIEKTGPTLIIVFQTEVAILYKQSKISNNNTA